MRNLIFLLGVLLLGWLAGGTWFWVCKVRGLCDGPQTTTTLPEATATVEKTFPANFEVTHNGAALFQTNETLLFPRDSANGSMSMGVETLLADLVKWLKEHPDTDLEITGAFAPGELTPEGSLNLGLDRANYLKDWLQQKGLDPSRMIISYKQLESTSAGFNKIENQTRGIGLSVLDRGTTATAEASDAGSEASSSSDNQADFNVKTVYFDFNSAYIPIADSLRSYLTNSIQYLRQHPESKLYLEGHTDGAGASATNMALGMDRANKLKDVLLALGLDASQISVSSQGEEKPVASNETEAGKALNRRVEIQLK